MLGIEKWVVNGTRETDWQIVADLASRYPDHIVPSFGYHPWYINERSVGWVEKLTEYLQQFPKANVGEIGLDRWVKDYDIDDQREVFIQQWQLAEQLNRPITVHCLRAWGVLVECLPLIEPRPFLLHSYSGSKELVATFCKHGAYFSVSGYFFDPKKHEKLAVFESVPQDRVLLETDAPAMSLPEILRQYGETDVNHPSNLSVIYDLYSKHTGRTKDDLSGQIATSFRVWQKI